MLLERLYHKNIQKPTDLRMTLESRSESSEKSFAISSLVKEERKGLLLI